MNFHSVFSVVPEIVSPPRSVPIRKRVDAIWLEGVAPPDAAGSTAQTDCAAICMQGVRTYGTGISPRGNKATQRDA